MPLTQDEKLLALSGMFSPALTKLMVEFIRT